ncbi:MAG: hypothetical protein EOO77_44240 [Oxalobacteraceae bacterium]|nr:MAG: hypothetical protein EOO77_44240 [Oxalobacteraceae bacterium]
MKISSILVAALSSALLFFFGYALAPWRGNLFGGYEMANVPVWFVCVALGGALAVDALLRTRAILMR